MYFLYWYLHCVPQTKPKLVYTHTSQQHSKQLARLSLTSIIPTSFPRQDLKTSIAVEFIQVVRGNFGCSVVVSVMLSDCNPFVFFSACFSMTCASIDCIPVCARSFIKTKIQFGLQLPASSTLIYLPLTHGDREGEEEVEEGREWLPTGRQCNKSFYLSSTNHSSFFLPLSCPSLKWHC